MYPPDSFTLTRKRLAGALAAKPYVYINGAASRRSGNRSLTVQEAQRTDWSASAGASGPRPGLARFSAWLTPREVLQVNAAMGERVNVQHRARLADVRADLAAGRSEGALISVTRACDVPVHHLTGLVQDFPGTPVIGFVAQGDETRVLAGTAALGRAGVDALVDCRTREGWHSLRRFMESVSRDATTRAALARVVQCLNTGGEGDKGAPDACLRFFSNLFAPHIRSAKHLAAAMQTGTTTFTSRFARAGLPSPKRYLAFARLVRAAHLGEVPGMTIHAIADRIGASSAQSYGRTVRRLLGITATEFRRTVTGTVMLERFMAALVIPHRETLRTFNPVGSVRTAIGRTHAERAGEGAQ
ncbi:MAG: helix-turn-helix domain-containing protein [Gemmatimonadota bacterium]